jgi:hypothetical protein
VHTVWFCCGCPCLELRGDRYYCGGFECGLWEDLDLGALSCDECVKAKQGGTLGAIAFNVN